MQKATAFNDVTVKGRRVSGLMCHSLTELYPSQFSLAKSMYGVGINENSSEEVITEECKVAKILVTDDAKFMRSILCNILQNAGHEIDEAENGQVCLQKMEAGEYDLITLDITMPEMDGLSALKVIKKKKPNQKVIMVSAMGQQAMVLDAVRDGAIDFIVKPFKAEKVIEVLNKVLG